MVTQDDAHIFTITAVGLQRVESIQRVVLSARYWQAATMTSQQRAVMLVWWAQLLQYQRCAMWLCRCPC